MSDNKELPRDVYVSDESVEDALECKRKHTLIYARSGASCKTKYLCIDESENVLSWRYIAEIKEPAPFTDATFPKDLVWVRNKTWPEHQRGLVTYIRANDVFTSSLVVPYDFLLENWEISLDGGETWGVAGVESE